MKFETAQASSLKNEKLTIQRYLKTFRNIFDYSVKTDSLLNTAV